jgi:hypothetical protein
MGFCDIMVRDQEAFRPVIRTIGQHFIINISVKNNNSKSNDDDP